MKMMINLLHNEKYALHNEMKYKKRDLNFKFDFANMEILYAFDLRFILDVYVIL